MIFALATLPGAVATGDVGTAAGGGLVTGGEMVVGGVGAAGGGLGAAGGAEGVTPADTLDATDVPASFVAVAVKVYLVPLVRPVTTHDVEVVVQVAPPGEAVAV